MPTYEYLDTITGKTECLRNPVADRDAVPPHLKRITVPQRVGFANAPGLKEPGADVDVPKAFRQMEEQGKSVKEIETATGFSREHIRRTWDF